MSGFLSRGQRISIALGDRSATAATRSGGSAVTATVPVALEPDGDVVAALGSAFAQLDRDLTAQLGRDTKDASIHVALLPPLADARLIRLPPLRLSEAESVIRRDAARHFIGGAAARIVSVIPARNGEDGQTGAAFMAAAARTAVVDGVHAAAHAVGWRLDSVVPAHGAWLAAAGGSAGSVLAVHDDVVHIMHVEGARCAAVRRAPASLPDEIFESIGNTPGRALVFAETNARASLTALLSGAGWEVDQGRLATAAEIAASKAGRSRLEFVPPTVALDRRHRARRNIVRAAVLAGLLLAGAAAVELWGAQRELEAVRAERAAIRDEVEPLLAIRDSIDRIGEEAQTVRHLESTSPLWTRALFDLALLLPRDVHITSLHTTGDTLVVEATGARAGAALQALRRAGSLSNIRLVGPVERDLEDGATATERFRFTARLKPPVNGGAGSTARSVDASGSRGGRP